MANWPGIFSDLYLMTLTQKKTRLIAFCILLVVSSIAPVSSRSVETQTVLAALTLNVARFTRWPKQVFIKPEAPLNLCVFGGNIVQQSFDNIDDTIINNRAIHIINLSRLRNLGRCQLLFLSGLDRHRLTPLLIELRGWPILTVGENMEFLQAGGMVGLEKINGKIQLTINLSMVKKSQLVISSRLLKLAKIVNISLPTH